MAAHWLGLRRCHNAIGGRGNALGRQQPVQRNIQRLQLFTEQLRAIEHPAGTHGFGHQQRLQQPDQRMTQNFRAQRIAVGLDHQKALRRTQACRKRGQPRFARQPDDLLQPGIFNRLQNLVVAHQLQIVKTDR